MTADIYRSPCGAIELRCGRWQEVLADVKADCCLADPPYGTGTHAGHAGRTRHDIRGPAKMPAPLPYDGWSAEDVDAFVERWAGVPGWLVALTSHDLFPAYQAAMDAADRYTFAPVPIVTPGMSIRLCGDGPSSWTVYAAVGRPRSLSRWGTLPGAYVSRKADSGLPGGKNLQAIRAIVRDYSRPGDLICDPCAGGATTLLAAAMEGRRAIGAEMDRSTWEKAVRRLERGYTPSLQWRPPVRRYEQSGFDFPVPEEPEAELELDENAETDYEPDDDYEPDPEWCAR